MQNVIMKMKQFFRGDLYVVGLFTHLKLEDLKVLRRSPDLLHNVKIGQSQLQLIMEPICFTIYVDCRHFGQVTKTI